MESLGPITRNKTNLLGQQASQASSASVPVVEIQSLKGATFFPTELEEEDNIVEIVEMTLARLIPFHNKNPNIQDDNDALITRSAPITPQIQSRDDHTDDEEWTLVTRQRRCKMSS
ncbi:hypothetical protein RND71_019140 [Anisodus tanguticus]|uniref:Uncharacterized protein n=1 Tax=Anisodus tanguticus TaxID=243964 RepID=A0AAE1V880_9SOLA|nr:hypothetical protein RND71_019140 [Anisodus tanguticus]